jgi:azurin
MHDSKMLTLAPGLALALVLFGCGSDDAADREPDRPAVTAEATGVEGTIPPAMQAFRDDGNVLEIEIEGDDQIRYNLDRLNVRAGQMVRLTLRHVGNLPAQAMGHNVVIIHPDDDVFEFGADVGEQGGNLQNGYMPESLRERAVAFTALIGGGETTTVEFQAPSEPGEYPFLCSFPGHFGQMNGIMVVEP